MGITNDNLIALMQSPKIENKLIAFEMIRNTDVVAAWSLSKDIAKVKAQELAYESFMSWQDVWERSEQLGLLSHVFPHLTFEVFGGIMNDYRDKYDRLIQMYQRVLSQFDPNTKEGYVDFISFYRAIFRNETKSPTP